MRERPAGGRRPGGGGAWIAVWALALGCAGPGAVHPMLREAADFGEPAPVTDAGGSFTAQLSIPFSQETDEDGTHAIRIPLEGSVEAYCFVWTHESELGATVVRTGDVVLESVRDEGGFTLGERQIAELRSGEIEGVPYQSMKTVAMLGFEDQPAVALMKAAAANKQGRGIACNHWDAGYSATFDRIFEELVRSFEVTAPPPAPFYEEIAVVRIAELDVGVISTRMRRDAEGDVETTTESSLLIPRSASEVGSSYSRTIEWSTPNGWLINAFAFETAPADETLKLALRWYEEGGWHVAGSFQGKAIDTGIGYREPLGGALAEALILKNELAPRGERDEVSMMRWLPDANPVELVEATIRLDEADPDFAIVSVGGIELRVSLDEAGTVESARMKVAGNEMRIERIFQRGAY